MEKLFSIHVSSIPLGLTFEHKFISTKVLDAMEKMMHEKHNVIVGILNKPHYAAHYILRNEDNKVYVHLATISEFISGYTFNKVN